MSAGKGGKRKRAGRKPLDPHDDLTRYCIDEFVRVLMNDPDILASRVRRGAKVGHPEAIVALADLDELRNLVDYARTALARELDAGKTERHGDVRIMRKVIASTREDMRHVILECMREAAIMELPPPTKAEIGAAYREVASNAESDMGVKLTTRQVERRIGALRKAGPDAQELAWLWRPLKNGPD